MQTNCKMPEIRADISHLILILKDDKSKGSEGISHLVESLIK